MQAGLSGRNGRFPRKSALAPPNRGWFAADGNAHLRLSVGAVPHPVAFRRRESSVKSPRELWGFGGIAMSMIRAVAAACLFAVAGGTALAEQPAGDVARGKYLVTMMGCTDCHTPGHFFGRPDMTKFLGGSDVGFRIPGVGYVWGANLTPDSEHGIGTWSEEQIVTSLRTGARPDGRILSPIMPWMAYAGLTDEDAYAIAAFLKTIPPVAIADHPPQGDSETPAAAFHEITFPPGAGGPTPPPH